MCLPYFVPTFISVNQFTASNSGFTLRHVLVQGLSACVVTVCAYCETRFVLRSSSLRLLTATSQATWRVLELPTQLGKFLRAVDFSQDGILEYVSVDRFFIPDLPGLRRFLADRLL